MPAAIVIEHLHARESHAVSQIQIGRTYVSVGSGSGFADYLSQLVRFNDSHQDVSNRLGYAALCCFPAWPVGSMQLPARRRALAHMPH